MSRPVVTAITVPKRSRPWCSATLHRPKARTMASERQDEKARRQGRDVGTCPHVADYTLDGAALCRHHAAYAALQSLLKPNG